MGRCGFEGQSHRSRKLKSCRIKKQTQTCQVECPNELIDSEDGDLDGAEETEEDLTTTEEEDTDEDLNISEEEKEGSRGSEGSSAIDGEIDEDTYSYELDKELVDNLNQEIEEDNSNDESQPVSENEESEYNDLYEESEVPIDNDSLIIESGTDEDPDIIEDTNEETFEDESTEIDSTEESDQTLTNNVDLGDKIEGLQSYDDFSDLEDDDFDFDDILLEMLSNGDIDNDDDVRLTLTLPPFTDDTEYLHNLELFLDSDGSLRDSGGDSK